MRLAFWDGGVWIQGIGFQNYGTIIPAAFSRATIDKYKQLTFDNLRAVFVQTDQFNDNYIREILERRNQILRAASRGAQIP